MSILIKGMKMPEEGTYNIVHIYSDGHVAMPFWGKGMQIVQDVNAVEVVRCHECKHNPKKKLVGCPMADLNERQRPEDAWCWKCER